MKEIEVKASKPYTVSVGEGLLPSVGAMLSEHGKSGAAVIVSDTNVFPLYGQTVKKSLEDAGFQTLSFVIEAGERSKNTDELVKLLEFCACNTVCRSDTFVALGGGVVGDLCGLAAAVYMRGVDFVQLPTSLLAAVDSSVGGKCAVDLKAGKNLCGAFHQPIFVLCDTDTLSTLPPEQYRNGMGEVIKYGMLDAEFLRILCSRPNGAEIIEQCVNIKANYVEEDEFDRGLRAKLNLGHTVGHAVELCSEYKIAHGEAVGIGMAVITRIAARLGQCPLETLDTLLSLLEEYGLPAACPYTPDEIFAAALKDKKNTHGILTLVMPCGIGQTALRPTPVQEFFGLLKLGIV